jgi:hypothetical protein
VWPSFGHLLEAKKDVVSRETKDGEHRDDFFETAKHTKRASVSASPVLTIRWRDGYSDPDIRAEGEMWTKISANLTQAGIVDWEL